MPQHNPIENVTTLTALDGHPLSASVFEPTSEPRTVCIISGATGATARFYAPFARFLAGQGLVAVTYDYRDIGRSCFRDFGASQARLHDWGQNDLAGVIAWARQRWPRAALTVVGHSVGGQLLGLDPNNADVSALLSVAAPYGYWRMWTGKARFQMAFTFYLLIPGLTMAYGHLPGRYGTGASLPKGVALDWSRWARHPEFLLREQKAERQASFSRFHGRMLSVSIAGDTYAPKESVDAMTVLYTKAARKRRHYERGDTGGKSPGHFGYFHATHQDTLWQEAVAFLHPRGFAEDAPEAGQPGLVDLNTEAR